MSHINAMGDECNCGEREEPKSKLDEILDVLTDVDTGLLALDEMEDKLDRVLEYVASIDRRLELISEALKNS